MFDIVDERLVCLGRKVKRSQLGEHRSEEGLPVGDLSEYFSRREFSCRCGCGADTVDVGLIAILDEVRQHFNAPVTVTSGMRCPDHNRAVGGSSRSQHILGRAADIQVKGVDPSDVFDFVRERYPSGMGFGRYPSFTHIDSRSKTSRWVGS